MPKQITETNVDSNLWAAAMRSYEEDRGLVDRAQGRLRKNQLAFEKQGIPAATIRARYKERDMSSDERQQLYAEEVVSRRALNLNVWTATDAEDFNVLMERAAAIEPADEEALDGIEGARAYSDGFNGGAHGGLTPDDNKHVPGTIMHQQWARGCGDGIDHKETFGNGAVIPRTAPAMGESQPTAPAAPKKRGRPKKASALDLLAENAEKLNGDEPAADDTEGEGLFSDLPAPPAMPD